MLLGIAYTLPKSAYGLGNFDTLRSASTVVSPYFVVNLMAWFFSVFRLVS